jgi:hypothetical protein
MPVCRRLGRQQYGTCPYHWKCRVQEACMPVCRRRAPVRECKGASVKGASVKGASVKGASIYATDQGLVCV